MIMGHDVFFFGRNVEDSNIPNLFHVHYLPHDPSSLKIWTNNYKYRRDPFSRTSDNLLFYARDGNDYLILDLIAPNGHLVFSDKNVLTLFKHDVENFVNKNIIP